MIRIIMALLPHDTRGKLLGYLFLSVLSSMIRALGVVLLIPLVATLFSPTPAQAWGWVGWLAAATVAAWYIDWLVAKLGFDVGFTLLETGQHGVSQQVARTKLGWFNSENTAIARQAIASNGPDLVGLVIYLGTPLLTALFLPIVIGIAVLPFTWHLGVAMIIAAPLLLGLFWWAGRLVRAADETASRANRQLTERLIEFARTQKALRAARRMNPASSSVGQALDSEHGAQARLLARQAPGELIFGLTTQVVLACLIALTVVLSVQQLITVPEAIALFVVITRYLEPFTALAGLSSAIETSGAMLGRIKQVLDAPPSPVGATETPFTTPPRIELRDVSFAYDDQNPVLEKIDLVLEPGQTTAIIGPSGSGKSTILALIAGLYEPTGGQILFDDVDAATLTAKARAEVITMVFQQPFLFDGTLEENIRVGAPQADQADLDRAAALSRVSPIVTRLDQGYDSRVGELGTALSGGERQRVSIARALVSPAPVLLVDEATSALDTENEAAITASIAEDPTPRTRIIVAHRLGSIQHADQVVFLDRGHIIETGTLRERLAAGGRLATFWQQQHDVADWQLGQGS